MRQSALFTKTRREAPKDEVAKNAELLIRAGFVSKEGAGLYGYLPLGLITRRKIEAIIRREMMALGATEFEMTALQSPSLWQKTDRWSDEKVDNWFKTSLKDGGELGLGFTHEEPITAVATNHISSYRDLPFSTFQIQTKFRNEARAKSGVLRGREFLMKDLYSFHATEGDLDEFYDKVKGAYERIYEELGLGEITFLTFASGGVFSKFSHEFQTLCPTGEDVVYLDRTKKLAVNKEVLTDDVLQELGLKRDDLEEVKTIEVGNIFKLMTRFSEPLGLVFTDEKGNRQPVIMASYGMGVSRLLGTIAEALSDDKGLVWPRTVAPFDLHLVEICQADDVGVKTKSEELYREFKKRGVEVLYDDRELGAGEKFADADLIGIPYRLVVSNRTVEEGKFELKERMTGNTRMLTEAELYDFLSVIH